MTKTKKAPTIGAIDIGYGSLSFLFGGLDEKPRVTTLPVGTARVSQIHSAVDDHALVNAAVVTINDESWYAGVQPSLIPRFQRKLNDGYTQTDSYRALFFAALSHCDEDEIDVLVTGLPVNLFESRKAEVVSMMEGTHQIAPKRSVTVKKVVVQRQPAGAFYHTLMRLDDAQADMFLESNVLIADGGFFSFDHVVFKSGQLDSASAGHNDRALSRVLDEANKLIAEAYSRPADSDKLESLVREYDGSDKPLMLPRGLKAIDVREYIVEAGYKVGVSAAEQAFNACRGISPDIVLLTGGCAPLFKKAFDDEVTKVFGDSVEVLISDGGVAAIVSGFYEQACHVADSEAVA